MAQTMASDLELECRLLLWLERAAFLHAYMLAAMFPKLAFVLSVAFQVLYFLRWVIQSDNPPLKRDSWVLFIPEHVAAVLLEVYLMFGRPPSLAARALLLFGGSSMVRISLAWWAKRSGEDAEVRAKMFDEGTEKTWEENSVAEPPPPRVLTKEKKRPVLSVVELEADRRESPKKETAVVAEPNPMPAKAAACHEEKTSEAHVVDQLDETEKLAARCEANDEEPPLGQPQEIAPGDEATHMHVPPPAPVAGMCGGCLQSGVGEYWGSWGGGYYASPWASERDNLLEELDKANAAANDYYQVAARYGMDVYRLTTENHRLFLELEDLTAHHDIDREEQVLLRESFEALCNRASYLDGKIRGEVSCAEYYKECCLEYSEGKGILQEENARLQAEVEDLRKRLDESECKRQALEEKNAQLGAETEELRKDLDESECKREDLEEENARFVAESENLRKYLDKCECRCEALEEANVRIRAETEELRKQLDESECKREDLKEENAQLVDETEELRNYLDNSERERVALEKAKARFRAGTEEMMKRLEESERKRRILEEKAWLGAETEELRKRLDESERKRRALEGENARLNTNLSGAIALCKAFCFVLKSISLFNEVNS